jgi:tRNA(Ile)-lysidine synthase
MSAHPGVSVEAVRSQGLLRQDQPVVVLLSGGRDSTCLLDLAVRIAGPECVSALHVNYGLRDAADAEEHHCRGLCRRLGVVLVVEHPRRPEQGNLQAWARDVRYGAAARIALPVKADIAAGHTSTDQVETVLYRLSSSPSRRALLGMPARKGSLVRPLLGFSRAQTAAYCTGRGLAWREDESNEGDAFARARVRNGLVPAMRAIHPAAERNVLALVEVMRAEAAVLDALLDGLLAGEPKIELARLRALEPALRRLVVQRLADAAAGGPLAGAARHTEDLIRLSDQGTVTLDIGRGIRGVSEYGVLRFELSEEEPEPAPTALAVPGRAGFGHYEVRCELGPPAKEPGVLDRATLARELLVRPWRPGDRMAPLGLRGSKSLQDLFTAQRVPRARRPRIAVVESAGEIAWVAGVATSERFKVTAHTREAAHLSSHERPQ